MSMRYIFIFVAVIVLLVLHQNHVIWERDDLIFGFLPYQLAYDGALSILTALVWLVAVTFCWPVDERKVDGTGPGDTSPVDQSKARGQR